MTRKYISNFDASDMIGSYDVVILGSGIAGLYTSLMLDRSLRVLVVSKSEITESNSYLAQGGIAASMSEDEAISHIEDTIVAGCKHNDLEAVQKMILESKENIEELIRLNVPFDRNKNGSIHMTKEGGHRVSRILHVLDKTGEGIVEALVYHAKKRDNIEIFENTYAVDVVTSNDTKSVCGVVIIKDGKIGVISAKSVVIATGGIGKLYQNTTNASISTGDGIGIAYRAGASFKDMEFVQFHPTAFISDPHDGRESETLLISEAVRGEGAKLVNSDGEYFMESVHQMKDLAPRNIVAEAIFNEFRDGRKVYLDLRHLDAEYVKRRFPSIFTKMKGFGIDITADLVPVTPVQHYFMGGIEVDMFARTSIEGLYACGEASNTGVHGANRLASNSLLEAIVYGKRAAFDISKKLALECCRESYGNAGCTFSYSANDKNFDDEFFMDIKGKVKAIMTGTAFIIRNRDELLKSQRELSILNESVDGAICDSMEKCEAVNMVMASKMIADAAIERSATLGSHILK